MIWLWVVAAFLLVIYAIYRYVIKDVLIIDQMFPGPFSYPLVGNAPDAFGSDEDVYKKINIFSEQFHTSFRGWFAHKAYVFINDPADAEVVLGSSVCIDKSEEYQFFVPWIGDGLLTTTGEKWKKHRKMLTPAFHFNILVKFIDIFHSNSEILCEKLSNSGNGKTEIDIYEFIKLYALDNICESAMGTKINAQKYPSSEYVLAIKKISKTFFHRALRLWYRSDFIFNISPLGAIARDCLKVLHGTTNEVIGKRKVEFRNSRKENIITEEDCYGREKKAFLDILLQAAEENALSDEDIRAEVDTFMFEGHDTITSGISFALFLLAEHPNVQDEVLKEVNQIFGKDNRPPTYKDLQEMKYLEQVIKETLRLYPSVPLVGRTIKEDLPLREGVYIPKGVQVVVLISAMHRSTRIWNNPHEFNPDNFTPDACQRRHPYSYLPFSAGPRNCIGQRFALLEMKCTLSHLVRRFEILPCLDASDKPQIKTEMVLNSKNGVRLRIRARTEEELKSC